jgi:Coenzyme PQQ synthesis protein D (PqqD)
VGTSICLKDLWEFPINDFVVLARPEVSGLYILSPSARLIWDILKAETPFEEIVREFASTYGIPAELAEQDVRRTLDDWRSGLLSLEPNSHPQSVADGGDGFQADDCFVRDYLIQRKCVRIILQTPELAEEIAPRLESLRHSPSAPDFTFKVIEASDGFCIFCDQRQVGKEESVTAARNLLLQEIVRSCRGRDCIAIFHAGACGSSSRCALFPAGTQSGKTTLAAVLMRMGLTFYSDDSVLLERDTLSVPAMPYALMVREGSWDVLFPRFPELQDAPIVTRYGQRVRFLHPVGMKQEGHCEQIGAIIFVRYEPGAANELRTLDVMQTLLRLQESGFWVAHDEQSIGDFLTWIQSTEAFTLYYSDVDEAASIIRRLVA